MLNFFKSKPYLKDLIPNGFVDIHSHILPGIDDGAKNIEDSLNLISDMKKLGFSKIVGTPHTYTGLYDNTNESIKKSFNKLNKKKPKDLEIKYASEYMLDKSIIEKAKNKNLLCVKDNLVLVEMSYMAPPYKLYEIIFEIRVNGYLPILAHPERYLFIQDFETYLKLKKVGCIFQANLLSCVGYYGRSVVKVLDKLIKKEMIDFVGSDIHNTRHILAFEKKVKIQNTKILKKIISNNSVFA